MGRDVFQDFVAKGENPKGATQVVPDRVQRHPGSEKTENGLPHHGKWPGMGQSRWLEAEGDTKPKSGGFSSG